MIITKIRKASVKQRMKIKMKKVVEEILNEYKAIKYGYFKGEDSPFRGLENGISIVVPLSGGVVDTITDEPSKTYFQHYRTTNSFIDSLTERIVLALIGAGYDGAAIPASQSVEGYNGLFAHKTGAVRAGLGYIGKSALFISDAYGPRVRMGTVFTDMPLDVNCFEQEDKCGDCKVCMMKCPAMAISGKNYCKDMKREEFFDAAACSEYMKRKFQHIGRGAVCGICMKYCPKGVK